MIAYLGYRYYKNKGSTTNNPQSTGVVVPSTGTVGQSGNPVVPDYSGELSQLTTGLSTLQGNLVGLNSGLQGLQGEIDALKNAPQTTQPPAPPATSGYANLGALSASELAALNPFNSAQSQAAQYAQYEQQYKPVVQQPVNLAPPVQAQQSFMSVPFQGEPIYPGVSSAYPQVQQIYNPYTNAYFGVGSILNAPNPYGPSAPQVIGPTIQSAQFGSGSKAFTIPGSYIGNPNQGGAIFVPGY